VPVEYCNSCTERWSSCPGCSAGQCSWVSPKRTCSSGESPSAEQSPPPMPGNPPSSQQSSRCSEYPSAEQPTTPRPGESPGSEHSFTPRPGESVSSQCSPLGAEILSPSGQYFCNKPSGSPNVYPWYASAGPTCSGECPSSEQSCWRCESPSSEQSCRPSESPSSEQSCQRSESLSSEQSCRRSESPSSEQSCHQGNYSCANPSGSPNGHSRYPTRDARCSSGGYPGSCGTDRGGSGV